MRRARHHREFAPVGADQQGCGQAERLARDAQRLKRIGAWIGIGGEGLDAGFGQRGDDLPGDLRAFALVGGRERFVADQKRVCVDSPGDFAHSGELFVELAAGHGGVLFALVVSEDAAGDSRAVGAGGDEHACLHHQLGHSETAQERRLPPLIGAGDDDERLAVGAKVVALHAAGNPQRQTRVIECARIENRGSERVGVGDAFRFVLGGKLVV